MTILALLLSLVSVPQSPTCETHVVPSGSHVMTCGGRVAARWDNAGNVRVYATDGRILTMVGGVWTVL